MKILKMLPVPLIALWFFLSNETYADPGHHAVIENSHGFLHYLASPVHVVPLTLFLIGVIFFVNLKIRERKK